MIAFGKTDKGLVRQNNEDAVFVSNEACGALKNLFIVADGMGGHQAGEVASNKAVEFFCDYIKKHDNMNTEVKNLMYDALTHANKMVFELSISDEKKYGMGTTLTACTVDGETLTYAHIGDSRLYVVNDEIMQITDDHSLVFELVKAGKINKAEAKTHPQRNMITKALGTERSTDADAGYYTLKNNDTVLICSDGLTDMLTDTEILGVIQDSKTCEKTAETLVDAANGNGGADNISVILIRQR